jgi:glycosyltransferase involved in cell wall biosynthesis
MACGIPCVLTNIGGAKNYIKPNINGRLCKPNNIKSIKNEWLSVLNNPDKYDKYVIRKIIIENYSIEKSAFKYLKLMKENIL